MMTGDELARELDKWPSGTPITEIEIFGMPLISFKVLDENDDEIPLFVVDKNGGYQLSPQAVKELDRNRIKPKPH